MVSADAATGAILGLVCGDALGRPVEFRSDEWIVDHHGTVTEMLGHGSHGQPPGTVTDDTDLAGVFFSGVQHRHRIQQFI